MVRNSDIRYPRGYRSFYSTVSKVQTQGITAKDFFRPKELKAKETKSVYTNAAEPLE